MDGEDWPVAGGVLTLLAGLLMLIDGAFEVWLGGVAATSGIPGGSEASGVLGGLGLVGSLIGLIVLVLGIMLYVNPDSHLGHGIAIVVLSAMSFFGGGGFPARDRARRHWRTAGLLLRTRRGGAPLGDARVAQLQDGPAVRELRGSDGRRRVRVCELPSAGRFGFRPRLVASGRRRDRSPRPSRGRWDR